MPGASKTLNGIMTASVMRSGTLLEEIGRHIVSIIKGEDERAKREIERQERMSGLWQVLKL